MRRDSGQLSLFEEQPKPDDSHEKAKTMPWSFSRRSTFEQCARRYYYEYYGGSKRTAKNEENKDELHFLKQIQNRYERTGSILHLVISHHLKKSQAGENVSLDRLEAWAKKMFDDDLKISANYQGITPPEGKYPPIILQELYFDIPNALALCQDAFDNAMKALRSFYYSQNYAHFRKAGGQSGGLVEHPFKIKKPLFRIDGKIDLAYEENGKIFIVDWKSGGSDGGGEDSLQLCTYALWGLEYYSCLPQDIQVMKAFLREEEIVQFDIDARLLNIAYARIAQDVERMISLEKYGEEAIADAFSPCGHAAICKLCAYRSLCPEGRNVTYA